MNILRSSTFLLTLAVVAFALTYANPASAKGKSCDPGDTRPKCQPEPPAGGTKFTVKLDGAFVLEQSTTSDGVPVLRGDAVFTIDRPAYPFSCSDTANVDADDRAACDTWSNVFDVCDIYKIMGTDPYGPDHFTITVGKKGKPEWEVYSFGGGVRIFFETTIQSLIDPLNPLDVALQLTSDCVYDQVNFPGRDLCGPFLPEGAVPTTFTMKHYWNHARGKKGVVHAQPCHVGKGELTPTESTITITRQ